MLNKVLLSVNKLLANNKSAWEALFQFILHTVVFIFYAFDKTDPKIENYHWAFFANYAIGSLLISYLLLPKLFYKKRYILFFVFTLVIVVSVILIEEYFLEQIYFPDTRGRKFLGFYVGLLDVLPIMTILFGMKFGWDTIQKQNEVEELKQLMKDSELSFLKSQLNPHFLFNNLNNLYSYALENSPKTPVIILEMSSLMRYILYDCKSSYVHLEDELAQLENYIKLNELQLEDRGSINYSFPDELGDDLMIAPLILMIFVENAFKHSMGSQVRGIEIDVKVSVSKTGILNFYCQNTFEHNRDQKDLPKGIGLENANKRLRLLYPEKYTLEINENLKNCYQVKLELQLDQI